jgi:hypothetical protein
MGRTKKEKQEVKEEVKPSQEIEELKASQPKQKKPRTEKQIQAFKKMREALASKKQQAKAEPKAEPIETEPIESKPIQRQETVELKVKNEVIKPIVERKEPKKENVESQDDTDFSNFDYDYSSIFTPQPAPASHVRVGNNTYSVQALKSYKNSLQHRKSHAPQLGFDRSVFY